MEEVDTTGAFTAHPNVNDAIAIEKSNAYFQRLHSACERGKLKALRRAKTTSVGWESWDIGPIASNMNETCVSACSDVSGRDPTYPCLVKPIHVDHKPAFCAAGAFADGLRDQWSKM